MARAHQHDTVLVLDYGSQYTQLIARRVREKGVYSALLPGDAELVSFWEGRNAKWGRGGPGFGTAAGAPQPRLHPTPTWAAMSQD